MKRLVPLVVIMIVLLMFQLTEGKPVTEGRKQQAQAREQGMQSSDCDTSRPTHEILVEVNCVDASRLG